ncbi:hypothetical protein C7475_101715 [Chitinophaga sp. S165]|nr:hypothetical protein C7475_101715 [Chitinophaga sp. S165]
MANKVNATSQWFYIQYVVWMDRLLVVRFQHKVRSFPDTIMMLFRKECLYPTKRRQYGQPVRKATDGSTPVQYRQM